MVPSVAFVSCCLLVSFSQVVLLLLFGFIGAGSWHVSHLMLLPSDRERSLILWTWAGTHSRTVYSWGWGWGSTDGTVGTPFCVSGSFPERRGIGQTEKGMTYVSTRNEGCTLECCSRGPVRTQVIKLGV